MRSDTLAKSLSPRQQGTVERLLEAGRELAEQSTPSQEGITMRLIAHRAGVAPATAYTYFSTLDALYSHLYMVRLSELSPPVDLGNPVQTIAQAMSDAALLMADHPQLSAMCRHAILSPDPVAAHLRHEMGAVTERRIAQAMYAADVRGAALRNALALALSGAMLQGGLGDRSPADISHQITTTVRLCLQGNRSETDKDPRP